MKPAKRPLFLARAPYRLRRLRDAARLLPILGFVLLILPLLWAKETDASLRSGEVLFYFGVWTMLILVAAAFAPGLKGSAADEEEED